MWNNNLKKVVYRNWDEQYFNDEWNLVKTVLNCGIIIEYWGVKNKVTQPKDIRLNDDLTLDDIPF